MKAGGELRLFSKDRRRQFGDVRRSHSKVGSMSQSQLTKSVGKSRMDRSTVKQQNQSRMSNFQVQDSRALKQSKLSQQNQESKSHKNLMCVCCYNQKQAQMKKNRRYRQQQKQQREMMEIKEGIVQENLHKQLLYENHINRNLQQVNEFNKKLIERHRKEKLEEQRRKQQEDEQLRIQKMESQREKQNRMKNYLQKQNSLKERYIEQMRMKQEKENQEKRCNQFYDNFIIDSLVPQRQVSRSALETIRAAYKDDLLKQIEAKEQQKKMQLEDRKGISPLKSGNEFDLITFAEKRNDEAKRYAEKLKQDNLKIINEKKTKQIISKQRIEQQRMNQQRQRKQALYEQQIQKQRDEQLRRQKIQSYLCDLKGQIEANKRKRLQELDWINQRKQMDPIIRVNTPVESDKQSCQGCHKKYPKKLLSEFVTIQE